MPWKSIFHTLFNGLTCQEASAAQSASGYRCRKQKSGLSFDRWKISQRNLKQMTKIKDKLSNNYNTNFTSKESPFDMLRHKSHGFKFQNVHSNNIRKRNKLKVLNSNSISCNERNNKFCNFCDEKILVKNTKNYSQNFQSHRNTTSDYQRSRLKLEALTGFRENSSNFSSYKLPPDLESTDSLTSVATSNFSANFSPSSASGSSQTFPGSSRQQFRSLLPGEKAKFRETSARNQRATLNNDYPSGAVTLRKSGRTKSIRRRKKETASHKASDKPASFDDFLLEALRSPGKCETAPIKPRGMVSLALDDFEREDGNADERDRSIYLNGESGVPMFYSGRQDRRERFSSGRSEEDYFKRAAFESNTSIRKNWSVRKYDKYSDNDFGRFKSSNKMGNFAKENGEYRETFSRNKYSENLERSNGVEKNVNFTNSKIPMENENRFKSRQLLSLNEKLKFKEHKSMHHRRRKRYRLKRRAKAALNRKVNRAAQLWQKRNRRSRVLDSAGAAKSSAESVPLKPVKNGAISAGDYRRRIEEEFGQITAALRLEKTAELEHTRAEEAAKNNRQQSAGSESQSGAILESEFMSQEESADKATPRDDKKKKLVAQALIITNRVDGHELPFKLVLGPDKYGREKLDYVHDTKSLKVKELLEMLKSAIGKFSVDEEKNELDGRDKSCRNCLSYLRTRDLQKLENEGDRLEKELKELRRMRNLEQNKISSDGQNVGNSEGISDNCNQNLKTDQSLSKDIEIDVNNNIPEKIKNNRKKCKSPLAVKKRLVNNLVLTSNNNELSDLKFKNVKCSESNSEHTNCDSLLLKRDYTKDSLGIDEYGIQFEKDTSAPKKKLKSAFQRLKKKLKWPWIKKSKTNKDVNNMPCDSDNLNAPNESIRVCSNHKTVALKQSKSAIVKKNTKTNVEHFEKKDLVKQKLKDFKKDSKKIRRMYTPEELGKHGKDSAYYYDYYDYDYNSENSDLKDKNTKVKVHQTGRKLLSLNHFSFNKESSVFNNQDFKNSLKFRKDQNQVEAVKSKTIRSSVDAENFEVNFNNESRSTLLDVIETNFHANKDKHIGHLKRTLKSYSQNHKAFARSVDEDPMKLYLSGDLVGYNHDKDAPVEGESKTRSERKSGQEYDIAVNGKLRLHLRDEAIKYLTKHTKRKRCTGTRSKRLCRKQTGNLSKQRIRNQFRMKRGKEIDKRIASMDVNNPGIYFKNIYNEETPGKDISNSKTADKDNDSPETPDENLENPEISVENIDSLDKSADLSADAKYTNPLRNPLQKITDFFKKKFGPGIEKATSHRIQGSAKIVRTNGKSSQSVVDLHCKCTSGDHKPAATTSSSFTPNPVDFTSVAIDTDVPTDAVTTPSYEATEPVTTPEPESTEPETTPAPEPTEAATTPVIETTEPVTTPVPEMTEPEITPAPETSVADTTTELATTSEQESTESQPPHEVVPPEQGPSDVTSTSSKPEVADTNDLTDDQASKVKKLKNMLEILEFLKKVEKYVGNGTEPLKIGDENGGIEIKLEKIYVRPDGTNRTVKTLQGGSKSRDLTVKAIMIDQTGDAFSKIGTMTVEKPSISKIQKHREYEKDEVVDTYKDRPAIKSLDEEKAQTQRRKFAAAKRRYRIGRGRRRKTRRKKKGRWRKIRSRLHRRGRRRRRRMFPDGYPAVVNEYEANRMVEPSRRRWHYARRANKIRKES